MRHHFVSLFALLSLPAAAGTISEHLRMVALPGPGCQQRLQIMGFIPNGHGEDAFAKEDALGWTILKDMIQMNRLFHVVEGMNYILNHTGSQQGMRWWRDRERTQFTPRQSTRDNIANLTETYGATYVEAGYGRSLISVIEHDTDEATRTLETMEALKRVLRQLAFSIGYLAKWHQVFLDTEVQNGNISIVEWIKNKKFHSHEHFEVICREISARTEIILRNDESGVFRPIDSAKVTQDPDEWSKRLTELQIEHLPEVAKRAVTYLRENLIWLRLHSSAVYQRLLEDLVREVEAYNAVVSTAVTFRRPQP